MDHWRKCIGKWIYILIFVSIGIASSQVPINGWISPTATGNHNIYVGFLDHYSLGGILRVHLGQDFEDNHGDPVYALADGTVIDSGTHSGYGEGTAAGGALIARFTASDGSQFIALYGHLDNPHAKGAIVAGEVLGNTNLYTNPHLHFGIHPGTAYPSDGNPWRGFLNAAEYDQTGNTYGYVDPINFLNTHSPA